MMSNETWNQILVKNRPQLVDNIDVTVLYTYLRSNGVISQRSESDIKNGRDGFKQKEALLDYLAKRPKEDKEKFCQALIDSNQEHIVNQYLKPLFMPVQEETEHGSMSRGKETQAVAVHSLPVKKENNQQHGQTVPQPIRDYSLPADRGDTLPSSKYVKLTDKVLLEIAKRLGTKVDVTNVGIHLNLKKYQIDSEFSNNSGLAGSINTVAHNLLNNWFRSAALKTEENNIQQLCKALEQSGRNDIILECLLIEPGSQEQGVQKEVIPVQVEEESNKMRESEYTEGRLPVQVTVEPNKSIDKDSRQPIQEIKPQEPIKPRNLHITKKDESSATFEWECEEFTEFSYACVPASNQKDDSTTSSIKDTFYSGNNVSVRKLIAGTLYTFEVWTMVEKNESEKDSITFTTVPNAPRSLEISQSSIDNMQVSWEKPNGHVDKFCCVLKNNEKSYKREILPDSNTLQADFDIIPGSYYTVEVYTEANGEKSSKSFNSSFTTEPCAIRNLEVRSITTTSVQLTWDPPLSGNVDNYMITSTEQSSPISSPYSLKGTEYTVTNLKPGCPYKLTITTVASQAYSKPSSIEICTDPAPPNLTKDKFDGKNSKQVIHWKSSNVLPCSCRIEIDQDDKLNLTSQASAIDIKVSNSGKKYTGLASCIINEGTSIEKRSSSEPFDFEARKSGCVVS